VEYKGARLSGTELGAGMLSGGTENWLLETLP
jgi:hypothetical protein